MPKRYDQDGLCAGGAVWASGSCGAISGAKIAIRIHATAMTMPMIASGWRQDAEIEKRLRGAATATGTCVT